MNNPLTLNAEILLLCERMEMAKFLRVYLQYLFRQGLKLPSVQLLHYRDVEHLPELVRRLPHLPGQEQLRKLVIFADATENLEERNNLIAEVRGDEFLLGLEYCAHFFFPARQMGKRWRKGYLEDLLLEALRKETAENGEFMNLLNVGREYLVSVDNYRGKGNRLRNPSRHLLYTYLAGTELFAGLNLAEAAKAGVFALDAAAFDALRHALEQLADD